jgi:hypothetical protein
MAMRKTTILATAATLLLSLTSAPLVAQEINILGPGKGWKLQSQHGPEGQNVYSYDCAADAGLVHRHRAAHMARRTRMVGR